MPGGVPFSAKAIAVSRRRGDGLNTVPYRHMSFPCCATAPLARLRRSTMGLRLHEVGAPGANLSKTAGRDDVVPGCEPRAQHGRALLTDVVRSSGGLGSGGIEGGHDE